ncbi:hypothetical protein [Agarivorans sp. Alg241-V36]|uniref:hypothetical protein n=1 Tax=Agarivorans sp. Alg241-V36 TaxID=2305992 RepID=UPI0013D84AED|nr:hypothetical protein [Agarivorans sp. Alg241-V36]
MDLIALLAALTIIATFILIICLSNKLNRKWLRYTLRTIAAPIALMTIVFYSLTLDISPQSSETAGKYLFYLSLVLAACYLLIRNYRKSKKINA